MKLRHAVLLLVVANGLYWSWSHGLLRTVGLGPAVQTDPARMTDQIAADAVSVQAYVPPAADGAAAASDRAPAPAGGAAAQPADRGATPTPLPAPAGAPDHESAEGGAAPAGPAGNGAPP